MKNNHSGMFVNVRHHSARLVQLGTLISALALFVLLPAPSAFSAPDAGEALPGGDGGIWRDVEAPQAAGLGQGALPAQARLVAANVTELKAALAQAPLEGDGGRQSVLALPLPDGTLARFRIEEYSMMEPGLALKFPQFKTYWGWGLDDPTLTARLSWTEDGFHATVQTASTRAVIAPYQQGDITHYLCSDEQAGDEDYANDLVDTGSPAVPQAVSATSRSHTTRHTYRLAVATTGEYAQEQGGTVTQTLAVIVNTINVVNGIYERDFSIRLVLIANNDQIIYTDGATDPYTDSDASAILNENQANLDTVIGSANYDIGHCFRSPHNGLGRLDAVCHEGGKAKGTGSGSTGMALHEMGHQFGSHHTHNASGDCGRADYLAYEPGSGSTIMSYAGKCGQSILDSQEGDNVYFHVSSLDKILDYVTLNEGKACGTHAETGNTAPAVEAGPDYTIPARTPFVLSGSGSDADGDALTYTWEEFDLGPEPYTTTVPNRDDDGNARPIFRSFPPTASPVRTLPRLADILDGSYYGPGESLPTINRTMQFRLIARDGRGGLSYDTKNVTVAGSAGSFRVTAPTGVKSLPRASQQTVTWNVANTNAAPVSCPSVNVLLSTDGGATFTTLAANTPNDGSALVTLPDLPPTSLAFKVECANNIFFDISPNSLILCTSVSHDDHEAGFSGWTIWDSGYYTNPWQTRTDGGYSGNNYFYVEGTGHYFTDSYLESPTMTVVGASPALAFIHRYAMQMRDASYASDGGVVEVSVNGGAWADVGSARFIQGGYNTVITTSYQNVLKGRPAFSGDSLGYITSIVDLSGLAEAGDSVQVRFRQATDGWYWTAAWWGWAVDDVLLCRGDPIPLLSIEKTVALSNPKPLPGDSATYKIVVANQGGADAVGVRVTDTLPAYMNGTDLDQTVNVAANSRVTLTIPATIDAGAPDGALIQNTASFVHVSSTAYWPDSQRQGQASTRLIVNPEILYLPLVVRNK